MIRTAVIGLWVCAVTLAGGYAGMQWQGDEAKPADAAKKYQGKLTQVRPKPVNIPVIEDGRIAGYIVASFAYTAPADVLKTMSVKPDLFIQDAAFNGIYSKSGIDMKRLSKDSWPAFTASVKAAANARLGSDVIADLVLEEFGFVPADQVRGKNAGATEKGSGGKRAKQGAAAAGESH